MVSLRGLVSVSDMSEVKFFDIPELLVQTDPTITFGNGMVVWLAEKGETVELTQSDWNLLVKANSYIQYVGIGPSPMGKGRYAPITKEPPIVAKAVPKDDSIFGSVLRFLFGRN